MARLISWSVGILLLVMAACQQQQTASPLDDLLGVWTTSDPKYADRHLTINQDTITFGVGRGESQSYRITDASRAFEEDHFLYTISYVNDEGQRYKLHLISDPYRGGVIRLKNRKQYEWRKQGSRK